MPKSIEEYTPVIIGAGNKYAKFLVVVEKCPTCSALMVRRPHSRDPCLFPPYRPLTFEQQAQRAGLVFASHVATMEDLSRYICVDCATKGVTTFLCALCNERRHPDLVEEQFGLPPEYLCKTCYASVSAKTWNAKVDELAGAHRYDFE